MRPQPAWLPVVCVHCWWELRSLAKHSAATWLKLQTPKNLAEPRQGSEPAVQAWQVQLGKGEGRSQ